MDRFSPMFLTALGALTFPDFLRSEIPSLVIRSSFMRRCAALLLINNLCRLVGVRLDLACADRRACAALMAASIIRRSAGESFLELIDLGLFGIGLAVGLLDVGLFGIGVAVGLLDVGLFGIGLAVGLLLLDCTRFLAKGELLLRLRNAILRFLLFIFNTY